MILWLQINRNDTRKSNRGLKQYHFNTIMDTDEYDSCVSDEEDLLNITEGHERTCAVEIIHNEKHRELQHHLGTIFGKDKTKGNFYFRDENWYVKYDHEVKPCLCWCNTEIYHRYYLYHKDVPAVYAVIGSVCMKKFSQDLYKQGLKQRVEYERKSSGMVCKECNEPLMNLRKKIQREEKFCSKECKDIFYTIECKGCGDFFFSPRGFERCTTCWKKEFLINCPQCTKKIQIYTVKKDNHNKGRKFIKCCGFKWL